MQILATLIRYARAKANALLPAHAETVRPLESTQTEYVYGAGGDIAPMDIPQHQKKDSRMLPFDLIWIWVAHVSAIAIGIYLGMQIAAEYGTITDPVMDDWQMASVYSAVVVAIAGIGLGILAFSTLPAEFRVVCGMSCLALTSLGAVFLWNVWLHPQLPQLMETVRLILDIRSGSNYSPTYAG
jgi:hypothetical protein